MKSARLTAIFLAVTITASLTALAVTRPSKPHHSAVAAVTAPLLVADDTQSLREAQRASRSRLYVAPAPAPSRSPKAVQTPVRKVRTAAPKKIMATRRAASVTGRLHDITMYCDTGSRTASGKWPQPGMVATARRDIPFGTVITIDGLGKFTVEDRIGHGSEFDIFTHSCSDARNFGRHHLAVSY